MADPQQIIDIPGVGQVAFPAGMSDFDITKAIRTQILPKYETKAQGSQEAFGNGLLFNFGDEVKAGARALVGPAIKKGMEFVGGLDKRLGLDGIGGGQEDFAKSPVGQTSTAPTVGERYDEELTKQRAKDKKFATENPTLAGASNIAGNVVGSLPVIAALPEWLTATGPSLAINALRGAAVGGGLGAAAGYGEGEGGNRGTSALKGGAFGAALGGVIPVGAWGLGQAYERVAPPVLNAIGNVAERFVPKVKGNALSAAAPDGGPGIAADSIVTRTSDAARNAATKIEDEAALKRLALTMSGRYGPDSVQGRVNALGEGAFLADANKGTERLAYVTQANSDDAAEAMLQAYLARNSATGTRFKSVLPEARDAATAGREMETAHRQLAQTVYGTMEEAGFKNSPGISRLMTENPQVAAAVDRVLASEKAARAGTDRPAASVVDLMHKVKREIQNIGLDNGRPTSTSYYWNQTGDDFVKALKAANPELAAADRSFAESASLPEWFERGQNFAAQGRNEAARNASPEALAYDLPRATVNQRNALAEGTVSEARRIASQGPDQTRRLAKQLTEGDDMVARLNEILGPEVTSSIINRANAERTFAEKFGNVMRGSQTAERNATLMRDQGISPPATGDIMSILRWARDAGDKLNTPSEAVRRKLGDLLTNPNAAENAETIRLVREVLARQAPYNALRGALPGAAGSQASGP